MTIFNTGGGSGGSSGSSSINVDFIPITLPKGSSNSTKLTTIFNNKISDSGKFKIVSTTFPSSTYYAQYGKLSSNSAQITSAFQVQALDGDTVIALYDSIHDTIYGSQTSSGSAYRWGMISAAQNNLFLEYSDSNSNYHSDQIWLRAPYDFPSDCFCCVASYYSNTNLNVYTSTSYYAFVLSTYPQVYGIFVYYK